MEKKYIFVATTLDTKFDEANYICSLLNERGLRYKLIDLSTSAHENTHKAEVTADYIADFHPSGKEAIFTSAKYDAITMMAEAFQYFMDVSYDVCAIVGLGGSCGTAMITQAMQRLPIGLPKFMVSTMASGNVFPYVRGSDIVMINSICDLVCENKLSRKILKNVVNQVAGAVLFNNSTEENEEKESLSLTMFGVTTPCVKKITNQLKDNYDCQVFHAVGVGGSAMEQFIAQGEIFASMDITLTEIMDLLFGGELKCEETRLNTLFNSPIPMVLSSGALDMINFGALETLPQHYRHRTFFRYNPYVTLIRTSVEENQIAAKWIGNKINQSVEPVHFIIPEKGFSSLDSEGGVFYDPDANHAFIKTLEDTVIMNENRKIYKYPYHINDTAFSEILVKHFYEVIKQKKFI